MLFNLVVYGNKRYMGFQVNIRSNSVFVTSTLRALAVVRTRDMNKLQRVKANLFLRTKIKYMM